MIPLRILLIAYEFPPIIAAQSLRWFYLSEELAKIGVEVHVLCPNISALEPFPFKFNDKVVIHHIFPGPFIALSQRLAKRINQPADPTEQESIPVPSLPLKAYHFIRKILDNLIFPDLRTEWYPFARNSLGKLLGRCTFDALISSYEPGVDLLLGMWAQKEFGIKWIVDLGDPVVAPYTPKWRRKIDLWFEKNVLDRADKIVLTTDQIKLLLLNRHYLANSAKFVCIPQGYPHQSFSNVKVHFLLPKGVLNLVFTGTFYRDFRSPTNFASALRSLHTAAIRTTIIGDNFEFLPMFQGIHNIKFIRKINHFECLAIQQQADLLLNIGNVQNYQLPGKIYEYLGASKPILHIRTGSDDPGAELIQKLNAGIVADNDPDIIFNKLSLIIDLWKNSRLEKIYHPDLITIANFSWEERAKSFKKLVLTSN